MMPIREAKEKVKKLLIGDAALRGVGTTWRGGHQYVLVNVAAGADEAVRERLRRYLPDVEFVLQEVGEITAE